LWLRQARPLELQDARDGGRGVESAAAPDNEILREVHESLRLFWDEDAATYERSLEHVPHTHAQWGAWTAALTRHLPPAPARVLDVGAGTGFLSLIMAQLGYRVTALDLSPGMLEILRSHARREGLDIEIIEGAAELPPAGPFDAVVERLLLWTLIDPKHALDSWRQAAPNGRLVCYEGLWAGDRLEALRYRARGYLRRLRREPPEHHAPYPAIFGGLAEEARAHPDYLVATVEAAGWACVRLERLSDVEWAEALAMPPLLRLAGVTPEFAVIADQRLGAQAPGQ